MEDKPILLSSKQVAAMISVSTRTLWRLVKSNKLPQPIRFNRKLVRWRKDDITKHIEELK